MEPGIAIFYGLLAGAFVFGIVNGLVKKAKDSAYNARLRRFLGDEQAAFKRGITQGRRWLAAFIAEAEEARDSRDTYLLYKRHPARKSAELVKEIKAEKRRLKESLLFLQYQLISYEEYFPFLEEYREVVLDEHVALNAGGDNLRNLEEADPTTRFLSREEWEALPPGTRNQLALDRYGARPKTAWEIGRHYERYVGYLREQGGWVVTYHGAILGFEDLGRDLVCKKDGEVQIVQAKCWSQLKVIHEKHIFQLLGTTIQYRLEHPGVTVLPVFVSTTTLSSVAGAAADLLGIRVERIPLPDTYPMIKCNINRSTKERIYHLPFDQQYDRVIIGPPDECYAATVAEAEAMGFRRAFRYRPSPPD